MEKNRELHDKLSKLERLHDELRRENEALGQDLRQAGDKTSDLARRLHRERRQHEDSMAQLEKVAAASKPTASTRSSSRASITRCARSRPPGEPLPAASAEAARRARHRAVKPARARVKATVARKDQAIADL
ncbi:uncharacterized protein IUM83_08340 [Phytophthora cinnamomi]|uniref:uncharacterized protein n=1 Tax=Phytophthora cinnamomi TaxID=4785 RepID=UPI00355AAF17|nr:hypothetical protein IUM83_08340 [Phytophthora cinnamomi]